MTMRSRRKLGKPHALPRPADDELNTILAKYNKSPSPNCKGLCHLPAVTRTARYEASARRMRTGRSASRRH